MAKKKKKSSSESSSSTQSDEKINANIDNKDKDNDGQDKFVANKLGWGRTDEGETFFVPSTHDTAHGFLPQNLGLAR